MQKIVQSGAIKLLMQILSFRLLFRSSTAMNIKKRFINCVDTRKYLSDYNQLSDAFKNTSYLPLKQKYQLQRLKTILQCKFKLSVFCFDASEQTPAEN